MFSSRNVNPSEVFTRAKQKEAVRYSQRIQNKAPSPFYTACEKGDDEYVKAKLDILSSDEVDQIESTGETPLHIATKNNHLEVVRLLLESGCNRNSYNSFGKFPYEEAKTDKMKQLYAPPASSQFFEENPKHSYGMVVPSQSDRKVAQSNATVLNHSIGIAAGVEDRRKPTRDQELSSEKDVMEYLTNRQALAMWIRICAWIYRTFDRCISRREEEGNDFAPELFNLDNDRDLESFLASMSSKEAQPIVTTEKAQPARMVKESTEGEEKAQRTCRQRFVSVFCCRNAITPAAPPSHFTAIDSVTTAQPRSDHHRHSSLPKIHGKLASSNDPRDFIRASKDSQSIVPLIYLYTKQELRFYAELNKNLANTDNSPNRAASICDRFVREFDLKEAELSKFGFVGKTYRGTTMSADDVAHYSEVSEKKPRWIIVPRTFQSTTVNRAKAMEFVNLKRAKGKDAILLVYEIPVACSTIFAVKEISRYPQEDEVLIMPGNLFMIMKVTKCEDDPTLSLVHLEHVKRDITFLKKIQTIYRAATTSASGID